MLGKPPESFPEGLDRMLLGMCVNERRQVSFPPLLSFGAYSKEENGEPLPYIVYDFLLISLNGSTEP